MGKTDVLEYELNKSFEKIVLKDRLLPDLYL